MQPGASRRFGRRRFYSTRRGATHDVFSSGNNPVGLLQPHDVRHPALDSGGELAVQVLSRRTIMHRHDREVLLMQSPLLLVLSALYFTEPKVVDVFPSGTSQTP